MIMITDTEIKRQGIEALVNALGEVDAERFISLMMREPFDYTAWQKTLWTNEDIDGLSRKAMQSRR